MLIDTYRLLTERGPLYKRMVAACWMAANGVATEDAGAPNHAVRAALADRVHERSEAENMALFERLYSRLLGDGAVLSAGDTVDDATIQAAVGRAYDELAAWLAAKGTRVGLLTDPLDADRVNVHESLSSLAVGSPSNRRASSNPHEHGPPHAVLQRSMWRPPPPSHSAQRRRAASSALMRSACAAM